MNLFQDKKSLFNQSIFAIRSSMILAHQCQITQLKDSYKERLRMNDDWPDKLAAELNKEREKHGNEIHKLKSTLTENFQIVKL